MAAVEESGSWLGWAGFHIKRMILKEVKQMPTNDKMITPRVNGQIVDKFLDVERWWVSVPANCRKSEASFTYLAFGMWEKFWEKKLEEEFMNTFGWMYDNKIRIKYKRNAVVADMT
jgi:hypothetical protein